jgi:hypothetical protein
LGFRRGHPFRDALVVFGDFLGAMVKSDLIDGFSDWNLWLGEQLEPSKMNVKVEEALLK